MLKRFQMFSVAICLAGFGAVGAGAAERVPLLPIGKIATRSAHQIEASDWSIGCEVLDRDFACYAAYKSYLGPLGAKAVRLQAGWAKTERKPGEYQWAWLDDVIDDARAQGTQPWVQFSYGNPAYPGGGGIHLGDGGPVGAEALAAWDRWVTALVRRYGDHVHEWEVWNESDIFQKLTLEQYVDLFIRTATLVRREQPAARMYALAMAHRTEYARDFLRAMERAGKLGLIDAITFHSYPHNPDDLSTLTQLRAIVAQFPVKIELRQGETGAPSAKTTGALGGFEWDEIRQVKWNLRRMLAHHGEGVAFNLFTLSEFYYPKGLNAKGLLRINPDLSVIGPKPAYFAAQHVFSIFDRTLVAELGRRVVAKGAPQLSSYLYRSQQSGRSFVTLWFSGEPALPENRFVPVDFTIAEAIFDEPVCVDLATGEVFALPARCYVQTGASCEFRGVPLYDSPILVASRGDLRLK